jgi:hypothetical protein
MRRHGVAYARHFETVDIVGAHETLHNQAFRGTKFAVFVLVNRTANSNSISWPLDCRLPRQGFDKETNPDKRKQHD